MQDPKKYPEVPIRSFNDLSKVKYYGVKYHIEDGEIKRKPEDKTTYLKDENLIIDYDDLSYIRLMKLFNANDTSVEGLLKDKKFIVNDLESYIFKDQKGQYKLSSETVKQRIFEKFHLRFYLPKDNLLRRRTKMEHFVIMINGMDERDEFSLYDHLGEFFCNNGIGAVLLPAPLHLNRRLEIEGPGNHIEILAPTKIALGDKISEKPGGQTDEKFNNENKDLFTLHYVKAWAELNDLIDRIRGGSKKLSPSSNTNELLDRAFYRRYFYRSDDLKISLLGYSLGGLKALSYFLHHNEGNGPNSLHSCILVNTCPDLEIVNPESLGIKPKIWKDLMKSLSERMNNYEINEVSDGQNINGTIKKLVETIKTLYFPPYAKVGDIKDLDTDENKKVMEINPKANEVIELKRKIGNNINRILAINGGADPIIGDSSRLEKLAPEGKSMHRITVAGVDHLPIKDPNWQDVFPRVERNIVDFIRSCDDLHYTSRDIYCQLGVLLIPLALLYASDMDSVWNKKSNEPSEKIPENRQHLTFDFTNDDHDKILHMFDLMDESMSNWRITPAETKARYLKYYYLSKPFYPHFYQLVLEIKENLINKVVEIVKLDNVQGIDEEFKNEKRFFLERLIKLYRIKIESNSSLTQVPKSKFPEYFGFMMNCISRSFTNETVRDKFKENVLIRYQYTIA